MNPENRRHINEISAPSHFFNKSVAGLNIEKGVLRYKNNEEAYIKILRAYAESVDAMLDEIKTVGNISDYKIKVHGIKGASLDIYADETGQKFGALEEAAKNNDLDFINANHSEFYAHASKFITEIKKMLSQIEAENPRDKKTAPDADLLEKLLSACRDYSLKKADEAMEEIEKYEYDGDGGLVSWLRKNLDMMNFMEIEEKLSNL
jgi:hypothetical protein